MPWMVSGSIKRKGLDIIYVATDLSAASISYVYEHCPNAVHVFDHFHVVKLMNEKVLICLHYLLLSNDEDIFDKDYKTRLDNALAMN